MMNDEIVDILLWIGIPASVKGFHYIHDSLLLLDSDDYYLSGKTCALYAKIAKAHDATPSQVERAMRHAFENAITKGKPEVVQRYLDVENPQNGNLLKTLYLRWKQDEHRSHSPCSGCTGTDHACQEQVYNEVWSRVSQEVRVLMDQMLKSADRAAV